MIAVFEKANNGSLVGLNSDYVVKVVEGALLDESMIEYDSRSGMAHSYLIAVRGTVREVAAKLNGKL